MKHCMSRNRVFINCLIRDVAIKYTNDNRKREGVDSSDRCMWKDVVVVDADCVGPVFERSFF